MENEHHIEVSQALMLIEDFIGRHNGNYLTKDPDEIWAKGKKLLEKRKLIEESNRTVHSKIESLINYYGSMIPEDEDKKY